MTKRTDGEFQAQTVMIIAEVVKTADEVHARRASTPMIVSIPELRSAFKGPVIGPDDPGYDEARTVFPGGIDRRPAVIIRVADADDVSRVVTLAREMGSRAHGFAYVQRFGKPACAVSREIQQRSPGR